LEQTADAVRLSMDDVQQTIRYALLDRGEVAVQLRGTAIVLTNQLAFTKGDESVAGSGTVLAPMHGNLLAVSVAVGDRVAAGQDVAVMEAMKMEHRLSAQVAGEVLAIHAAEGDQVATGTVLIEIAPEDQ
jgi:geranyl-CoA carboxylase alpha subunit